MNLELQRIKISEIYDLKNVMKLCKEILETINNIHPDKRKDAFEELIQARQEYTRIIQTLVH
jgi:predicted secreted protein